MKHLLRLLSIATFACFLFASCEGPAGADGNDGADGMDGLNGQDANGFCINCHNTENWMAKEDQYHLSKHFTGTSSSRNTKYCARCHTSDGFQEIVANGTFTARADMPNANRISCETCHAHSAFDFPGDTLADILSTNSPVFLNYDKNAEASDFGKTNNLCTTCHQIRGATAVSYVDDAGKTQDFDQLPYFPLDNSLENTTVKYTVGTSFSVHDGNQSNLFAGINAYEYAGKTYTRTWQHSSNKCTDCHMNEYNEETKTGGHTLMVNEEACMACHGSDKLSLVTTAVEAKLVELRDLLVAKKVFYVRVRPGRADSYSALNSHDFYGNLLPNVESADTFALSFSSSTGEVSYSTDSQFADRIGRAWKYGELGAAYNYGFINSELSMGVHNPVYAMQVLQNSIDWLKAN